MLTLVQGAVKLDPWLSPFEGALKRRFSMAQKWIDHIQETEGGLEKFSKVCKDSMGSDSLTAPVRAPF